MENFSASSSQREFSYLVDAMQPIDPDYTKKTFDEGERVKAMLLEHLPSQYQVTFDYQGSVTSDTHIRAYSDIDLLALHDADNHRPRGDQAVRRRRQFVFDGVV
jgi:tRNA nucleotidyltransferase (CCA-adding enzyme)